MRTALEWLNEIGECVGQDMFCGNPQKPGSRSEDCIKAIQLDAWKQGMTDAAAIVNGMRGSGESDLRCVRSNIEWDRDQKKDL